MGVCLHVRRCYDSLWEGFAEVCDKTNFAWKESFGGMARLPQGLLISVFPGRASAVDLQLRRSVMRSRSLRIVEPKISWVYDSGRALVSDSCCVLCNDFRSKYIHSRQWQCDVGDRIGSKLGEVPFLHGDLATELPELG